MHREFKASRSGISGPRVCRPFCFLKTSFRVRSLSNCNPKSIGDILAMHVGFHSSPTIEKKKSIDRFRPTIIDGDF